MPSSHAVIATALWTILALDFSYRVGQTPQGYSVSPSSFVSRFRTFLHAGHILPTASVISQDHFVVAAGFWSLALLPVPLSRVILKDHTAQQVFMAGIIGVVEAIIWFLLTLLLRVKTEEYASHRWLKGCLIHNWPAPRCYVPLKSGDAVEGSGVVSPPSTEGLNSPFTTIIPGWLTLRWLLLQLTTSRSLRPERRRETFTEVPFEESD
ncbi:hypothetical protein FOZ62_019441 [Perkinsus olseni]|uniref:Dolichyldiphosphatase 1 n=1 Tax=Perkinsus olseni TaxID=32597 RepID=A0A7J6RAE1_PEROL|nr:hypothetical protein FOZ62_019441 [Perkinsus olseni]